MTIKIKQYQHSENELWSKLGRFFANREIRKELGCPMSSDESYYWWVSEEGGEVVGFAAVEIKKSGAWLRHSYVFEASRKNGIYGKMLKARMSFLKQQDPDECPIVTCVATADSLPNLLKLGFKPIAEKGKYTTLRLNF